MQLKERPLKQLTAHAVGGESEVGRAKRYYGMLAFRDDHLHEILHQGFHLTISEYESPKGSRSKRKRDRSDEDC